MLKPIPKRLLHHTVTYEEYNGGSWGEEYASPITIRNVRVQDMSSMNRTNNTDGVMYQAKMFYDGTHSEPKGIAFKKGSRITFKGEVRTVDETETLRAFDDVVHHVEVGLK